MKALQVSAVKHILPLMHASLSFHLGMQQRQQEFTNYRDYIGMDITSLVALPVWIMMPFSMLQNISEIMEYTDRLEKAAKTEDPYER